jgi:hypothetical protein
MLFLLRFHRQAEGPLLCMIHAIAHSIVSIEGHGDFLLGALLQVICYHHQILEPRICELHMMRVSCGSEVSCKRRAMESKCCKRVQTAASF